VKTAVAIALVAAVLGSLPAARAQAPNTLTAAEQKAGWKLLFDGKTIDKWRGYKSTTMPAGWQVVEGAMTRVAPATDIVTIDQFGDFDFQFEWQVTPGANSGVMFHVTETADSTYQTGPEYQILDNGGHADGKSPLTSAASNYAVHAPSEDLTKPVGSWNQGRLIVKGSHVEHWLNGTKVVDYELGSADWEAKVAASKFKDMPRYGREPRGHIAIQDHGDKVAFRNLKVK
jgi:hypothetical protein